MFSGWFSFFLLYFLFSLKIPAGFGSEFDLALGVFKEIKVIFTCTGTGINTVFDWIMLKYYGIHLKTMKVVDTRFYKFTNKSKLFLKV